METRITLITVYHPVFIVTFSTEAYFAVSLKKILKLFHFGVSLFSLLFLHTHLPYSCDFQCLLKHLIGFITMSSLEIQQNFIHPQFFSYFADFVGKILLDWSYLE